MKLWLPRALLLQLSQQTNAKLKINLLMDSCLSKQMLCARAALHLAVTTQAVPGLCPRVWPKHTKAAGLSWPVGWVSLPGLGLGVLHTDCAPERAELSGCVSLLLFDPWSPL